MLSLALVGQFLGLLMHACMSLLGQPLIVL